MGYIEKGVHDFKTNFSLLYKENKIIKVISKPQRGVRENEDIGFFVPLKKVKEFKNDG